MDKSFIKTIGEYDVGGITCEAKCHDHGEYVVVYSTVKGEDTPISGSQATIKKDTVAAV